MITADALGTQTPPARGAAALVCALALLAFALTLLAPPARLADADGGPLLYLHLLLELFAVLVAALVVTTAWLALEPGQPDTGSTLIAGFTVIAGCDLLHALSYQGMPALLRPASTELAIFFWLAGRCVEVLTLALMGRRIGLPGSRLGWQLAAVLAVLTLLLASLKIDSFPATYVEGLGQTGFKRGFEYLLAAVNLLLAALYWRRAGQPGQARLVWLAAACFLSGLGGLAVSCWRSPSELSNLLAHLLKVAAYALLFRATVLSSVRRPFELLRASLRQVSDLTTALNAHAIVAVTDARGVITGVNDKFCRISQYPSSELIGQSHGLLNSGYHPPEFFRDMWRSITAGQIWHGEICNRARDGSLYWVDTTITPFLDASGRPDRYIAIRTNVSARKRIEQEVRQFAYYDLVTGLPNRRLLLERLAASQQAAALSGRHSALLFLDLDGFKAVNDTMGHSKGDELLRLVAATLQQCTRASDTVARFGGDEFVVLLSELADDAGAASARAEQVAGQVLAALARGYRIDGSDVACGASIGLTLYCDAALAQEDLVQQADMAMYLAKEQGRNRFCHYEARLLAEARQRAALEAALRLATAGGQLRLHYQPLVDRHGVVGGAEALLRWQHPQLGLLAPAAFIALAEQSSLIVELGQWALHSACRQLAEWARDPATAGLTVAVNVSARQLHCADFEANVSAALTASGARPGLLKLELTESMLLSDIDVSIAKMAALRRLGVRFSLDDFGTGYSALSYLRRLPLDVLKIDRSFVHEIVSVASDATIVRAIMALASALGLEVVVEGVETQAQFELLQACGCHQFQGYLFSRPVPVEQFPRQCRRGVAAAETATMQV